MVTAQQPDHRLPRHTLLQPGRCHRIRADVQLSVGQRPGLVDDRHPLRAAQRRHSCRPGDRAEPAHRPHRLQHQIRPTEIEHPGPSQHTDLTRLQQRGPRAADDPSDHSSHANSCVRSARGRFGDLDTRGARDAAHCPVAHHTASAAPTTIGNSQNFPPACCATSQTDRRTGMCFPTPVGTVHNDRPFDFAAERQPRVTPQS